MTPHYVYPVPERGIAVNKWILVFLSLALYGSKVIAQSFPVPPDAKVGVVSEQANSQGMRLKIQKITSEQPLQQVLAFYKKIWADKGVVTSYQPWTMIGNKIADKFYNVQLQSNSQGTWGYLSVSDLPKRLQQNALPKVLTSDGFPAMSGSQILDSQSHSDLLNNSKTVMLSNGFSVRANSQYYLNYYQQRGWQVRQDSEGSALKARVLVLSNGSQNISLTIHQKNSRTLVIANVIEGKLIGG